MTPRWHNVTYRRTSLLSYAAWDVISVIGFLFPVATYFGAGGFEVLQWVLVGVFWIALLFGYMSLRSLRKMLPIAIGLDASSLYMDVSIHGNRKSVLVYPKEDIRKLRIDLSNETPMDRQRSSVFFSMLFGSNIATLVTVEVKDRVAKMHSRPFGIERNIQQYGKLIRGLADIPNVAFQLNGETVSKDRFLEILETIESVTTTSQSVAKGRWYRAANTLGSVSWMVVVRYSLALFFSALLALLLSKISVVAGVCSFAVCILLTILLWRDQSRRHRRACPLGWCIDGPVVHLDQSPLLSRYEKRVVSVPTKSLEALVIKDEVTVGRTNIIEKLPDFFRSLTRDAPSIPQSDSYLAVHHTGIESPFHSNHITMDIGIVGINELLEQIADLPNMGFMIADKTVSREEWFALIERKQQVARWAAA